jgi:hypothetical protein
MPQYDISFAEKLSQVASLVLADGIDELEAQRTVLYLSLLSTEIALKAMLEKAGMSVAEIRSRSHDIAALLRDLDHCNVRAEVAPGESRSVSASRMGAITLLHGLAQTTVGAVIDTGSADASRYPNEIRYGERLRHYPAATMARLSAEIVSFARTNWDSLHVR